MVLMKLSMNINTNSPNKRKETIPPQIFIVYVSPRALRVGRALNKSNCWKNFLIILKI